MFFKLKFNIFLIRYCLIINILCLGYIDKAFSNQDNQDKQDKLNILVLNSYHETYDWTDNIVKGIKESFYEQFKKFKDFEKRKEFEFYIEYMDAKRASKSDYNKYLELFYNIIKTKYEKTKIDIIIPTDDDALLFILKYHDEIFKNIPVVFCGVNNFEDSLIKDKNYITGIVQRPDICDTINLAVSIHPNIKNVFVIVDKSITGQAYRKDFENISKNFPNLNFNYSDGEKLSHKELFDKLGQISQDSMILLALWVIDKNNDYISIENGTRLMVASAKLPLYGITENPLSFGLLGGKIQLGYYHGQEAAQTALKILFNNEKPNEIAVKQRSPNKYIFDYQQLVKYKISEIMLPAESLIINKPKTFYSAYKELVWVCIIAFCFCLSVIIILVYVILKKIKIEKELVKTKNYSNSVINLMPSLIIGIDLNEKVINWNYIAEKKTKILANQASNNKLTDILPEFKDYSELIKLSLIDLKPIKREKILRNNLYFNIVIYPIIGENNQAEAVIIREDDITQSIKAQEIKTQDEKMKTIGSLAYGIAHEVNSFLSIILQSSQTALERLSCDFEPNFETAKNFNLDLKKLNLYLEKRNIIKYLNAIREYSVKASNIMSNMLDFSHTNKNKFTKVNINKLIDSIIELSFFSEDYKILVQNIEIIKEYCQENLEINCIQIEIEQVIFNILKNAIRSFCENKSCDISQKSSKNNEVSKKNLIVIRTQRQDNFGIIEIQDNGSGIEENIKEDIFKPFFTTKDKETKLKSAGLGLSISHFIIANNHNGSLYLKPQIKDGSCFVIKLPIGVSESDKFFGGGIRI